MLHSLDSVKEDKPISDPYLKDKIIILKNINPKAEDSDIQTLAMMLRSLDSDSNLRPDDDECRSTKLTTHNPRSKSKFL